MITGVDQAARIMELTDRIAALEAQVRALRSAGYSCPTCDNDAVDSVADRGGEHG